MFCIYKFVIVLYIIPFYAKKHTGVRCGSPNSFFFLNKCLQINYNPLNIYILYIF